MTDYANLSDRELNDRAAVDVMGWEQRGFGGDEWYGEILNIASWSPEVKVEDWNPCNDWNDMRLVIEKLHDEGYAVTLEFNHKRSERNKTGISDWTVGIDYIDPSGEHTDIYSADDVKPGRAVCIAALKAAGVDKL